MWQCEVSTKCDADSMHPAGQWCNGLDQRSGGEVEWRLQWKRRACQDLPGTMVLSSLCTRSCRQGGLQVSAKD